VAAAHPSPPPYGTTPTRSGGGGGGAGGGTPATVTTDVHASFDGGTSISFTFPTTNHGSGPVIVKAIEWSIAGGSFNVTDTVESGEEAGPGSTVTPAASIPGSPASEPETVTVRAVAVFTDAAGREHRSPPVTKGLTLNPDGTITEGPGQSHPVDPKLPVEPKVTVVVSTDQQIDLENQTLVWHVNAHNGTDAGIAVTGTVYSVVSGPTTFNSSNENGSPVAPGETGRYSDVVPMGPSGGAPYQVTITAFVEFGDGDRLRSSATGSITFTIDAEGVVNGTASAPADTPPDPADPADPAQPAEPTDDSPPLYIVDCFTLGSLPDGQTLQGFGRLSNHGGQATGVSFTVLLDGAASSQNTVKAAGLPGGQVLEAEVSVVLPAERTDPLLLVLQAVAVDAFEVQTMNSRQVTVLPDGTVQQG
jgi:hypothetical protein